MQTADDLNANADASAALYAGVAMFVDADGTTLAGGGDEQALTVGAGGDAGPTSDHAAVDGIAWSEVVPFDLTEVATHFGLFFPGNVLARVHALPSPLGPGDVPFVCGIGPAAL